MKKNWSKITKIVPELQKEWAEQNYEKAGVLATYMFDNVMDRDYK